MPNEQVVEGGELDINFELVDPNGKQLIYDEKSSDDSHEVSVKTPGDYSFCMDNSFSSITNKLVYLDLGITKDEVLVEDGASIDSVFKVYVSMSPWCLSSWWSEVHVINGSWV